MEQEKKIKYKKRAYKKTPKNNQETEKSEHKKTTNKEGQNSDFLRIHKEKIALLVLFLLFIAIGSSGLGKFFTTDETAWYYNWVQQYWNAYSSGDFLGTNLTTYPGSLHSFLCGFVNLFLDQNEYLTYDKVETYLFWWRFPILLFNAISLIGIYYLLKKFFSQTQSFVAVFLMAFSPYLIGMSRIVNPDSLLWSTSLISILSYIIFVREQKNKYMIIAGIFMGMALASKMNAILLFIFFPITLILEFIFSKIDKEELKIVIFKTLIIWLIAMFVFSVFLPAVFVNPRIYYNRVFRFFITNPIFISIILFILADTYLLKNKVLFFIKERIVIKIYIIRILPVLFLTLIIASLIVKFTNFQLESWNSPNEQWKIPFTKALYLNFFEYFNSQQIAIIVGFIMFAIVSFLSKRKELDFSIPIIMLTFIFIFILGSIQKGVQGSGHRYGIMMYPFAIIITVWAFSFFKKRHVIFGLIALFAVVELSFLFPKYYIFYQNRRYFSTGQKINAWAIGGYDLAQEFNKLPNANNLKVYADRYSFKHFSKGYTENIISDTKASKINEFDYLCLSKSGRSQVPMSPPLNYYYEMPQDSFEYFVGNKDYFWMGLIKVDKNKKELKIPDTFDPEFYLKQSQSFTIAFWEKHIDENPGNIIYLGENYNDGIEYKIENNKMIIKYGENEVFESDTLPVNKFNSIIIQHINKKDQQIFIAWINGEEVISEIIGNKKTLETKFFIATNFNGLTNDVRIYGSKLSEDQIKVIYNNGEMTQEQELVSGGENFKPLQHFTHRQTENN